MIKRLFMGLLLFLVVNIYSQKNNKRWNLNESGGIIWKIKDKIPHSDHIEMSGKRVSAIVRYKVNKDNTMTLSRQIVWPMLRTIPNDTHGSLISENHVNILSKIRFGRYYTMADAKVVSITHNGTMSIKYRYGNMFEITQTIFPSTELPALCEKYTIKNISGRNTKVYIEDYSAISGIDKSICVYGEYTISSYLKNAGVHNIKKGEGITFSHIIKAEKREQIYSEININLELNKRTELVNELWSKLDFESPDKILNKAFSFAKIRASESIYQTKGGPMHGPGGLSYYAAIWANDQAEYIGPFFPFLGYEYGNEASLNAYMHFSRFMNDEYKPIPSSIIAEGIDIWHGAGDRGDGAMIAYGAARFALTSGDKETAKKLWPLIAWSLEFCNRKVNKDGVVSSDSDELEGRFPAGDANICTSSLYYDALLSASYLSKGLKLPSKISKRYKKRALKLKKSIEKHFGANVMGYDTYRYYEGNDVLRAWIAIPLTVDIFDRKSETIRALFSPDLWTDDGLATASGDKTFWDRATLYALRGVFASGEKEKGIEFLKKYSARRLLGEHVPYPIEAWPEGGKKHLSAESGLYCRVITEGMFGIRPTGLKSFNLTPQLPDEWDFMNLKNINAFGSKFDIEVKREGKKIRTAISKKGKLVLKKLTNPGETINVKI